MANIFENAYFGKPYKTRDGRKAIFIRKDEDTFDLETEDSYNPVRSDGSFLYTKEGYESCTDIISEWQEEINEEELDKLSSNSFGECIEEESLSIGNRWDFELAFKEGYRKALKQ